MTCPVPEEQQPLRQYQELQESIFFRWGTLPLQQFLWTNVKIWLGCWLITAPIAAVSYNPHRYLGQFLVWAGVGATLLLVLPLLRLYLGWLYVKNRLISPEVLYEETGWYDGQTWQKPEADRVRENLLVDYQIQPYLKRMEYTFAGIGAVLACHWLLWQANKF
jgi:hypothetical protein